MSTTPTTAAQKANLLQVLQQTPPAQLANLPALEERFVKLFSKTRGVSLKEAEMVFQTEKYHFQKALSENPGLRECETLSLYGCFMDAAVQNLSFDPKKKLAYIIPGSVNVGTRDNKQYVKRASLEVSPYGELAIRQLTGQIKYAENPIIVYEGDIFEPYQDGSGKGINYKTNANHGTKIIAAFITIIKRDGERDYHWLMENDWKRLSDYSKKKNNGFPNALYTSVNGGIDPGFLGAKLIKHAFKAYPKVNIIGTFSKPAPDPDPEEDPKPEDIYGLPASALPDPIADPNKPFQATMIVSSPEPMNMDGLSDDAKAAVINATADHAEPVPHTVDFPDNGEGF
jgi:recombinational DNA repair protein RecT